VSLSDEKAIFEIMSSFLERVEGWKDTIMTAARVFEVPDHEVMIVIKRLERLEEELLHYQIFGF